MLERKAHLNESCIQVDISPVERQQFTPSHARCERQDIQRVKWIMYHRRQEDARLLRGQDVHLLMRWSRRLNQRDDIALNDTDTRRLSECAPQNRMNTRHRRRSQSRIKLGRVERLNLLSRQPRSQDIPQVSPSINPNHFLA